ncbi:MAG: glycosyltransferase [Acidimicrobiales bacterium]
MTRPVATVLIPARDEHDAIAGCLERVLAQTVDRSSLEVVVVDGGSADGTASVAVELLSDAGLASWQVLTNPVGTTPSNLNVGLAAATGAVLCRVDARSVIPPDYVAGCVAVLEARPDVVVVGGRQVAVARDDSPRAVGIARALNNRYGMGGARYRQRGQQAGGLRCRPRHLPHRRAACAGAGGRPVVDQARTSTQWRMAARGTVWFEAGPPWAHHCRGGTWRGCGGRYVADRWKVRYWRQSGDRPHPAARARRSGRGGGRRRHRLRALRPWRRAGPSPPGSSSSAASRSWGRVGAGTHGPRHERVGVGDRGPRVAVGRLRRWFGLGTDRR